MHMGCRIQLIIYFLAKSILRYLYTYILNTLYQTNLETTLITNLIEASVETCISVCSIPIDSESLYERPSRKVSNPIRHIPSHSTRRHSP